MTTNRVRRFDTTDRISSAWVSARVIRLPATRIGKAYRIRRADLDTFAGTPAPVVTAADAARVTSIVDVPGVGPTLASKLAGAVTNSLHGSRDQRGDVHAEVVYHAEHGHLKIIVIRRHRRHSQPPRPRPGLARAVDCLTASCRLRR